MRLSWAGPDPRVALRESADLTDDDVAAIDAKLERLDRASSHGPWTMATLDIIRRRPHTRAPDLAAELGRERDPFKIDVRKLKNLGLTRSFDVGYEVSPRGMSVPRAHDTTTGLDLCVVDRAPRCLGPRSACCCRSACSPSSPRRPPRRGSDRGLRVLRPEPDVPPEARCPAPRTSGAGSPATTAAGTSAPPVGLRQEAAGHL